MVRESYNRVTESVPTTGGNPRPPWEACVHKTSRKPCGKMRSRTFYPPPVRRKPAEAARSRRALRAMFRRKIRRRRKPVLLLHPVCRTKPVPWRNRLPRTAVPAPAQTPARIPDHPLVSRCAAAAESAGRRRKRRKAGDTRCPIRKVRPPRRAPVRRAHCRRKLLPRKRRIRRRTRRRIPRQTSCCRKKRLPPAGAARPSAP